MNLYLYKAVIDRVVDGDTVDATVDLGFDVLVKSRFRLLDVDTPETFRPRNEAERVHGKQATAFAKECLEGKQVYIYTKKTGKYGRHLAIIYLSEEDYRDECSFNDLLIKEGFEKKEKY